ncbi:MAG: YDG domain-containing protein [Defluviitaleaceae bacterium]|nr:YDG domain-containing protein [Defluviitaleaceae bacterium]
MNGLTLDNPATPLNAGNGQSIPATFVCPSGNFTTVTGNITVNINQATQPILNITNPGPLVFGMAPFQLNYTGGGVGTLSVSSSNPAVLSVAVGTGNVINVTVERAGDATITINYTGDSNHHPVTRTIDLTVMKRSLSLVTIDPITNRQYTGTAHSPVPTLRDGEPNLITTGDFTHEIIGDNVNAGTVTVRITATANGNYEGTRDVTFNITPALLTVTANNMTLAFRDPVPTFTPEIDHVVIADFVNNETVAVLGGTLEITTDYTATSPAGVSRTITPSGLTSTNYVITFVPGTLTVTRKQINNTNTTINVSSSHTFTGESQTPTFNVIVNGVTLVSGTDFNAAITNNVNAGVNIGLITITGIGNYDGTATQTFSIEKATQTTLALVIPPTAPSPLRFGDAPFQLQISGGSGTGARSFTSNNENVIKVSNTGVVTIEGQGEARITVNQAGDDNHNPASAYIDITVLPREISNANIEILGDYVYTGLYQTPTHNVTDTVGGANIIITDDFTVTFSNNRNAGTASGTTPPTVTITATPGGNYTGSTTQTFEIKRAPLVVTALNESILFNQSAPAFRYAISGFVNNEDRTTANVTGSPAFTTYPPYIAGSPVGNYEIRVAVGTLTAPNYNFVTFEPANLSVGMTNQAPLNFTTVCGETSFVFNTGAIVLSVTGGSTGGAVTFARIDGSAINVTSGGTVMVYSVGTATIRATMEGNTNFAPVTADLEITITPKPIGHADISVSIPPMTYNAAYTNRSPNVIVIDTRNGNTVPLIRDTHYTLHYTPRTLVGTYDIEIRGIGNYGDNRTTTFAITRAAAPTIEWPTASAITFLQSLASSTLSGGSTIYGTFTWTNSAFVPTAAGAPYVSENISVTFTPNQYAIDNYNTITTLQNTIPITVNRALAPNVIWPTANDVVFVLNRQLSQVPFTGGSTEFGNFAWTDPTHVPVVGTHNFDVTFTPSTATANNFETVTPNPRTVSLTVTHAAGNTAPDFSIPTNLTATYGNTLANVAPQLPSGWALDAPSATPVGNFGTRYHYATFTPTNTNFAPYTTQLAVAVTRANQTGFEINPATITFGDTNVTLSTTGGQGDGAVTWERISGTAATINTNSGAITIVSEGTFTVRATKAGGTNHNPITAELTFSVARRNIANASISTVTGEFIYNGTAFTPTEFTVTLGSVTLARNTDFTVEYTNNINAGTATITIHGTGNYTGTAIATGTFTITPRPVTITGWNISRVFNGTNVVGNNWGTLLFSGLVLGQQATVTTTGVTATFAQSNIGTDIDVTITSGSFGMLGSGIPSANPNNYTVTQPTNLRGSITPANPVVNWPTGFTATFGQALSDIALPDNDGTPGTFSWTAGGSTLVGNVASSPNNHNLTFTPANAPDFSIVTLNIPVTVNPFLITADNVEVTVTARVFNGSSQTPNATVTHGTLGAVTGTWSNITNVDDTTTFTATGNFTGTLTRTDAISRLDISSGSTIGTFNQLTFTGAAQTPVAQVTHSSLIVSGSWSQVTNVGQITTFTATGNFIGTLSDRTINPAMLRADQPAFSLSPAGPLTLTHGDSPRNIIASGGVFDNTIIWEIVPSGSDVFSLSTVTLAERQLSNFNVGTAILRVTREGGTNHNPITASDLVITVNPANPVVNWPTDLTAEPGQTLDDIVLTGFTNPGGTPGTFSWTAGNDTPVGDAGTPTFNMTFTPTDDRNFNTVTQNITITVESAGLIINWPTNLVAFPHRPLSDISLPISNPGGTPGSFSWVTPDTQTGAAGTQLTTNIRFTPTDTNIEPVIETVTVDVRGDLGQTPDCPWIIRTPHDLRNINEWPRQGNHHYVLANDIDMTNEPPWNIKNMFNGVIDGNGYRIIGLTNTLFNDLGGTGVIRNIGLVNVNIVTTNDNIGTIANTLHSTALIENVFVIGTITGSTQVGGIVGNNMGIIRNSYTIVTVTGTNSVGGITGQLDQAASTRIENCVALGTAVSRSSGGLTNFGRVTGTGATGGTRINNFAREDMTVLGVQPVTTEVAHNMRNGECITDTQWNDIDWWRDIAFRVGETNGLTEAQWVVMQGFLAGHVLNNELLDSASDSIDTMMATLELCIPPDLILEGEPGENDYYPYECDINPLDRRREEDYEPVDGDTFDPDPDPDLETDYEPLTPEDVSELQSDMDNLDTLVNDYQE